MTDKIDSRLEAAKKAGALWAANPLHSNIVKDVMEREPFLLADRIMFDIHEIRRKEIVLQNIRRQNGCVSEAISLIRENRVNVDFLATHTFSLHETQEAFELASGYGDGVIKALIYMGK